MPHEYSENVPAADVVNFDTHSCSLIAPMICSSVNRFFISFLLVEILFVNRFVGNLIVVVALLTGDRSESFKTI